MSSKRILKSRRLLFVLICVIYSIPRSKGFVNSPKIITKDGNLVFESGMNRNITFRLNGKSRITINDQYDLLDLILLKKRVRNTTSTDVNTGDTEWLDGDETSLRKLLTDVNTLNTRVFGPQGIESRLRDLQNRSNTATNNIRRYNSRLTRIESQVQGLYARLELDSCKSDPCENGGTCFNLYNGFMCKCTKNFEGPTCQQDVNECALFAGTDLGCQNGGQCVNQFGGYSCICTPGWFGIHCTQRKGDCMQSSAWELCGHGTCVPAAGNDNFGYKCICDQGWKTNGLTPPCSVDVDECTESRPPCATKCINLPGSFTCSACPVGLEGNGVNCRDVDECATNNGGCSLAPKVPCINTYGSYHCGECPLGWSGDGRSCQRTNTNENTNQAIQTCRNPSICYPGAVCTEISNTVVCTCPTGMVGNGFGPNGCMTATTKNCGTFPCLNGGTCYDTQDSYACICPMGFKPPNCTPIPSACETNPCKNNGKCEPMGTSFTCKCPPGYTGRLCDTSVSRCGGVMFGLTGRLKYPEGSLYDHNAQCAWLIRTTEEFVLNVTFKSFELEDSTECRFDWLQLNDGRTAAAQVIGRFCGLNKPMGGNIISSTNFLYIWFRSDNSTAKEGFDLEWKSVPPQCGGVIDVTSHGTIATPGSPGVYPKNRDCRWQLRAPNNKRLKLTFFSMQIEKHESCGFDYVEIKDLISDVILEKYCNSSRPAPLLLPTNEVEIHFHSDNEGSDTGFQIYYSVEERIPGCGGTFTAKQGEIKSPVLIGTEAMSCEYDIKMGASMSISIEFIKFNMSADDCVELYDVNVEKQINELQAKYCGSYNFMPSIFHSIYNVVRVKYFAKGGEFLLKYQADCSYTYDAPQGMIVSPGYPSIPKGEHFCTYKILTEPGTVIELSITDFDFRDSSLDDEECSFTSLTINDGINRKILGPFCKEKEPPSAYVAESNILTLIFRSGPTSSGKGFKITYNSIDMSKGDCGAVYTKPGYTIKLPSDEDGNYLHDLECYWIIMAPVGKGILINWKSFSLEATFDCTYDYVEIFDSPVEVNAKPLGRYCDARPPPSFLSHSRLLTIKFVSDYSDSSDGFEASYEFVDIANQCGGEIFSSTGNIYSPSYPNNYTAEVNCTWIITVPHGSQLELRVEMFELEEPLVNTTNCLADYLEIRNGGSERSALIGRFCGKDIPKTIPSFTNQLRVTFRTDRFISARGFKIAWSVFGNGCGGVLLADNGIITSPLFPQPYPNDATCEWRIRVHPGSTISIKIEHIDIEDLFQCNYDYVEIFDGHRTTDIPLVKLCRMDDDVPLITTSSNEALVRFVTDSSNSQSGFLLSYVTSCKRNITSVHGTIESVNYGNFYMAEPVNCAWFLKAPVGNTIQVEFTEFKRVDAGSSGTIFFNDISTDGKIKRHKYNEAVNFESTGSTLQIVHNDTSVSFRLEYVMKGCIETLKGETGQLHSPNYPKPYPLNIECSWTIKVPSGHGIELTVEDLDLQPSTNCTLDALVISSEASSNHVKERHCGRRESFTITSNGHQMFVRFVSDSAHNGKGFNATYKTVKTTCGGTIQGKNGVITSPNYPSNYPQEVYCEWKIEVAPHHRIKFTLDDLDIEDFYDCEMDNVALYDTAPDEEDEEEDRKLFEICGQLDENRITTWTTIGYTAEIRFRTDDSNEQKGFKISFEEICGERIYITEETVGNFEIARHSQLNETCEWQIIAKDSTKRVLLTIGHVSMTVRTAMEYKTEEKCAENGVKIYDGTDNSAPLRYKFCKTHPPATVSNGNALTLSVPLYNIEELEAGYMTMDISCSDLYTAISGKFASPYYPSSYPVNLECEWWIRASKGNSLALTFEFMDIELSDGCNNDYVEIREKSEAGKLIGVYCGKNTPPAVKGLQKIWVKFNSDNENVGAGFVVSYNYEMHNEISGENGTIESPKYPSIFHSNDPYSYRITVDKDYVVLLTMKHIVDLDEPYIKFYDGYSDIGPEIDYTKSHVVRSNTNILYFTSMRGPFQFEWERMSKTEVQKNRTAEQNVQLCGDRLIVVGNPVVFSSPGYPVGYKDNLDCSWNIVPKEGTTHVILQFMKVDLEEFADCFADYVSVSASSDLENWKELERLCKREPTVLKLYHGTPYLKLDFHTDSSNNKTGFQAFLRTACGSTLTDQRGYVNISSLATGASAFQMECVWTITARQGRRVRIQFDESTFRSTNDTSGACKNYFLIRNGINEDSPFLGKGRYCDNDITDILDSTTNSAYIKFVRVGFPRFRAAFRYEEIMHECSDELILDEALGGRTVTITSPNYPNIANPHTECVWKITAPVHHIIAVHFLGKFDLTPASDAKTTNRCDREWVQLNDGGTNLLPMLGRYCGTEKPATIHTTGNVLRVEYFTDVPEPKSGFMANVTIASCGGFYYDSEGKVDIHSNVVLQGSKENTECSYTFEAPQDGVVRIDIDWELPEADNCSTVSHIELREIDSYGEVENITDILILCGELHKRFLVETNKLVLILRMKDNEPIDKTAQIGYKMLGSRCGETISAFTGILMTPGYPNGVARPTHCIWRLQVFKGKRIKLEFLDFDTGATALANTSIGAIHAFRGRIVFANDFQMQSIIARVTDNPPAYIYSTDNKMYIDAFLLSIGKHRGFKLRFTSEENSVVCQRYFSSVTDYSMEFRRNNNTDSYCSYDLKPRSKHTLALTINKYEQISPNYLTGFLCELFSPLKFVTHEQKLFSNIFCNNSTFPLTLRFPYDVTMDVFGTGRNKLSLLALNFKQHECGGLVLNYPFYVGDNTTISMPQLGHGYSGRLDCAWAVWPSVDLELVDWEEQDMWRSIFQMEVALTTDFKGKCEDQYLVLYNGPDQNSPELGRYCGQSAVSHLVAHTGLFVEYVTANYETASQFNLTGKQGSGCGGRLHYPYRNIEFDKEYYKNNVECVWDIKVETGFNLNVYLMDRFFIEKSEGCRKDYLKIQERFAPAEEFKDLKVLCGREPPPSVKTTGSEVRLIFRSDGDTLGDGFTVHFERSCGGILQAKRESQVLRSPGFLEESIPNNLVCNYTIIAPNSAERGILVRFDVFDIEPAPIQKCLFDNVTVVEFQNNVQEETILCGIKQQLEFRSQDRIEIILRTDQTFPSKRFSFKYSTNLCGGIITNSTIIESPHQQSDGNHPPSINCFWNLTAPEHHKIIVKFEELEFESNFDCSYDNVEIYGSDIPSPDQLLGKFCGNLTDKLPVISIPGNKAIIKSQADERDPSKGFKALIAMLPYCDQFIYLGSSNATYEFNTYAGKYDNDLDCSHVFRTEQGRQLQIEFTSFHMEEQVGCTADYLDIRDGAGTFADEIGRFCGHELPPRLTSSRNAMLVRVVSDEMDTSTGFSARITSIPTICHHNIYLTNDKKVTLNSPDDGSGKYPKNLHCFWKIKAEVTIHLKFNKLDIENENDNETCSGSYLKVYNQEDESMLEKGYGTSLILNGHNKGVNYQNYATEFIYCGNTIPSDFFSNSKEVYLKFKTDNGKTGTGFSIEAMTAKGCYRNFTGLQGRIYLTDSSDHCDIYMHAPENYTLSIYFKTLQFAEFDCDLEYIEIFDAHTNSSLKKLCTYVESGKSIFSNSNELRMRLKMNTHYTEYDMTYLASKDGPGCGGDFYNTAGIFTNPFYPENVRNNSECFWHIRVPNNLVVFLHFDEFDLGAKATCSTDYLEIIEHPENEPDQVMRRFCGGDRPKVYKSKRNYVTVHFHKTVNYDGVGWVLSFDAVYSNYIVPSHYLSNYADSYGK